MAGLPQTDHSQVSKLRAEYESLQSRGSSEASEACFSHEDVRQGVKLANALLEGESMDEVRRKDLVYFCCVGEYNLGHYSNARTQVVEFLKVAPNNRQAEHLKDLVEDKIMREGMIGLGILGVGAAAAAVFAAAVLGRR